MEETKKYVYIIELQVLNSVLDYGIYAWTTSNKLNQCTQGIHGRPRSNNPKRPQDAHSRSSFIRFQKFF